MTQNQCAEPAPALPEAYKTRIFMSFGKGFDKTLDYELRFDRRRWSQSARVLRNCQVSKYGAILGA